MGSSVAKQEPKFLRQLKADLRLEKGKAKVLIGLLPLLIVALIPLGLGGLPSKTKIKLADQVESGPQEELPIQIDQDLRSRLASMVKDLKHRDPLQWKGGVERSPFARFDPGTSRRGGFSSGVGLGLRSMSAEESLASQIKPSATFLSSTHGNVAIVDGEPYREGDEIGGFTVLEIGARSITLNGRDGEYKQGIPTGAGDEE